jgi:hypothetical protein
MLALGNRESGFKTYIISSQYTNDFAVGVELDEEPLLHVLLATVALVSTTKMRIRSRKRR